MFVLIEWLWAMDKRHALYSPSLFHSCLIFASSWFAYWCISLYPLHHRNIITTRFSSHRSLIPSFSQLFLFLIAAADFCHGECIQRSILLFYRFSFGCVAPTSLWTCYYTNQRIIKERFPYAVGCEESEFLCWYGWISGCFFPLLHLDIYIETHTHGHIHKTFTSLLRSLLRRSLALALLFYSPFLSPSRVLPRASGSRSPRKIFSRSAIVSTLQLSSSLEPSSN